MSLAVLSVSANYLMLEGKNIVWIFLSGVVFKWEALRPTTPVFCKVKLLFFFSSMKPADFDRITIGGYNRCKGRR